MIRRATELDIEEIDEADKVCFPHDHRYIFAWEKNVTWVARLPSPETKEGLELAAYITAHPLNKRQSVWFFSRVGVLPWARGRGLQRKLMQVMERHGRREGWREIVTYTVPANLWSTRNILEAGYRTYEPRKSYVGFDVVHMRKKLK